MTTATIRCCGLTMFATRRACPRCGRAFAPPLRSHDSPPVPSPRVALNILGCRVRRHWRQADLAARLGISTRTYISRLENGDFGITLQNLQRMAAVFGLYPHALLESDPVMIELTRPWTPAQRELILRNLRNLRLQSGVAA